MSGAAQFTPTPRAWLSAFAIRYVYAGLLVGYFTWLGAVPGAPLTTAGVIALGLVYALLVAGVQIYSRGRPLGPKLAHTFLVAGVPLLAVAVAHDPVAGMPLLLFALIGQIETGLRQSMSVYRLNLAASLFACAAGLAVRHFWVPGGIAPDAWWTAGYLLPISLYISVLVSQMHRNTGAATETTGHLDLVATATGIGFWVIDLEQGWLLWDDNTHRLAGLEPGTFRGTYEHFFSLLSEKEAARVKREFDNAVRRRRPLDLEYQGVWPDKSVHHITSRARMVTDDSGKVVRMVGASWEEARPRAMEDELIRSGDRLALALQVSGAGIWVYDVESAVVEWDENLHRIFGLKPGTFGGKFEDFVSMVHPADRARVQQAVEDGLAGRKEYAIEMRMIGADGAEHMIKTKARVYYDGSGKRGLRALKMVGAVQDVTDSSRDQERLLVLAERSRLILQAQRIGRWTYDAASDRQEADEGLEGLFGVAPGMLGSTLGSLLAQMPTEERTRFREAAGAVRGGEEFDWCFRVVRPDGKTHELLWTGVAQQNGAGLQLKATVRDLTRLRNSQRNL